MIGRCRYGRFGQALLPRLGTSPRSQASYTRWAAHWSRSANGLEINTPITRSRGHGIRTVALWVNRQARQIPLTPTPSPRKEGKGLPEPVFSPLSLAGEGLGVRASTLQDNLLDQVRGAGHGEFGVDQRVLVL